MSLINVTTVPDVNPQKPNRQIAMSFAIFQLPQAPSRGQKVMMLSMGGKIKARAVLEKAPTSEIISSSCGTVAAIATVNIKVTCNCKHQGHL